jgi:hypothetical protein
MAARAKPDDVEAMAKAIESYIERGGISFVELMRDIPGFAAQAGEDHYSIQLPSALIWGNMTETASQAVWKLFDERRACVQHTSWMVYACDGMIPADKTWTPMILRPGRFANLIGLSGVPFHAAPRELKAVKRKIAKDKKLGLPTPTLLKTAA